MSIRSVYMSSPSGMVQFVSDHSGKAMFGGFVSAITPGAVIAAGLSVTFMTKGRVNAMNFFVKPRVATVLHNVAKGSVAVCAASAVMGGAADYAVKKGYGAHHYTKQG